MTADHLMELGSAKIQHGPHNDRVYLMSMGSESPECCLKAVKALAKQHGYSKIIAKIPPSAYSVFEKARFRPEARVPGLLRGRDPAYFMARFLSESRSQESEPERVRDVLHRALEAAKCPSRDALSPSYRWKIGAPKDANQMADLYRRVFASYPFPIWDVNYLIKTMKDNVVYFGIWLEDELVAVAASEIDWESQCAELTDFACCPDHRGQGLARFLLTQMEAYLTARDLPTAFTIARSRSYGMNIVFASSNYQYAGTLYNNTQIAGRMESMNVWYKSLQSHRICP